MSPTCQKSPLAHFPNGPGVACVAAGILSAAGPGLDSLISLLLVSPRELKRLRVAGPNSSCGSLQQNLVWPLSSCQLGWTGRSFLPSSQRQALCRGQVRGSRGAIKGQNGARTVGAGPSGRSLMRKQGGFGTWLSLDRWVQPSAHWHSLGLPLLNFIPSGTHPRSRWGRVISCVSLCAEASPRGNQGAPVSLILRPCPRHHFLPISLFLRLFPHLSTSPGPQPLSLCPLPPVSLLCHRCLLSSLLGPQPSRPAWPSSLAPPLRL